jgi:hypothetical protein
MSEPKIKVEVRRPMPSFAIHGTLTFLLLKASGAVPDLTWWWVFSPALFMLALAATLALLGAAAEAFKK